MEQKGFVVLHIDDIRRVYHEEEYKMWLKTSQPGLYFYSHHRQLSEYRPSANFELSVPSKLQTRAQKLLNKTWESIRKRREKTHDASERARASR